MARKDAERSHSSESTSSFKSADSNELRERQRRALITGAGILADEDIPEWATSELVLEWVNRGREDNRCLLADDDSES